MKIFNVQPIRIDEYIYNNEHLAESKTNWGYSSGFEITGEKVDSLNTMYITFNIIYDIGSKNEKEVVTQTGPGQYSVEISFEAGDDIFISYKSSCQFNFESEGLDADLASLTDFLTNYDTHTKLFFSEYGYKPLISVEEETRNYNTFADCAKIAIENLRSKNMYAF
jgi:hypothetical protein